MPSVEGEMKSAAAAADTAAESKDYFNVSSDVEELVAAIKQNLRLKSRSCHSLCSKQKRMSPYDVPRTFSKSSDDTMATTINKTTKQQRVIRDDPYEMLQELLKEGSLIKEAVKRLQLGVVAPKEKNTDFYEFDCSVCDVPTSRTVQI